jgi:hypothetical protein
MGPHEPLRLHLHLKTNHFWLILDDGDEPPAGSPPRYCLPVLYPCARFAYTCLR